MLCFSGLGIKSLQREKDNNDSPTSKDLDQSPTKGDQAIWSSSSALELELADLGDGSDDEFYAEKVESESHFSGSSLATTKEEAAEKRLQPLGLQLSPHHQKEAELLAGHYSAANSGPSESQPSSPAGRKSGAAEQCHRGRLIKASPNFRWTIPSEELLPKIALYLGWRKTGGTMAQVSRQWLAILRGDTLWKCFMAEQWSAPERRGGWGGHDLLRRCGRDTAAHGDHEAKAMKEFKDRYRRRVDEGLGELRTGWDWVRERLGKDVLEK
jgi:hypothetical protein